MFKKSIILSIVLSLFGCTQSQRFDFMKNAQLHECATKNMKFFGQAGYQQAHQECHAIVNLEKLRELKPTAPKVPTEQFEPLELNYVCWDFVKNRAIDKYFPDLILQDNRSKRYTADEEKSRTMIQNLRIFAFPDKLAKLDKERLLMVRDTMSDISIASEEKTRCEVHDFLDLEKTVLREIHRRYPYGVD